MKYPDSHFEEVAKVYKEVKVSPKEITGAKTEDTIRVEKTQNKYPNVTKGTIQVWVNKAKKLGYL